MGVIVVTLKEVGEQVPTGQPNQEGNNEETRSLSIGRSDIKWTAYERVMMMKNKKRFQLCAKTRCKRLDQLTSGIQAPPAS